MENSKDFLKETQKINSEKTNVFSRWIKTAFSISALFLVFFYLFLPLLIKNHPALLLYLQSFPLWISALSVQIIMFFLVIVILFLTKSIPFRKKLGIQKWRFSHILTPLAFIIPTIIIASVSNIVFSLIMKKYNIDMPVPILNKILSEASLKEWIILGISITVLAPIIEEIIFRRIFFEFFKLYLGIFGALFASSFFFALVHTGAIGQIPGIFVLGLAFQIVYLKNKSLYPAIILHALNNILVFSLLIFYNSGEPLF